MKDIKTIGLDLAKAVFQVHGTNDFGTNITRRSLRRTQVLDYFGKLPACLVGVEACASAHYWAREIGHFGHTVRIIPATYVKPYVKRNKTDAADAEAICEAVTRPTMRFVPVKSAAEQAAAMIIKTRDLLTRQRTQAINALRSHMAELGIISAAGFVGSGKLIEVVRDTTDTRLPEGARFALKEIADQIERSSERISRLEKAIIASVRDDEAGRRLTEIPGVGPITAAAVRAAVPDPSHFKTGRDFAAWIGLTPLSKSSGGKEKLGGISKRGNPQLRTLLIVGAMAILKMAKKGGKLSPWAAALVQRRPFKVVAAAMANKTARIIWALLTKGEHFNPNSVATTQ